MENKKSGAVGPPSIAVTNLTKRFRRPGGAIVTPVDNVTLTVGVNELVVLLGPSGCGKTTLLRCVAGLETPDEGEIHVNGELVFSSEKRVSVPTEHRKLSMIFQSFALWPHMTVFENIAYPLATLGLPKKDIASRVKEVLELVGIAGLEGQHPGRVSGGQQQRVALARALVSNTSVVLFDEPLSNVDAQVRAQLRFELKRMQRRLGFSGLYVTHDQTEAMELGHRVAVLESGRIAALGEPKEIYDHPRSEYVARFVGTANFLPGKVVGTDAAGVRVETNFGEFTAERPETSSVLATLQPGERVSVLLRPEKIRIGTQRSDALPNSFEASVETRLFAGPYTEFVVQRGDTMLRIWSHDDAGLEDLTEGSRAWINVDRARVSIIPGSDQ